MGWTLEPEVAIELWWLLPPQCARTSAVARRPARETSRDDAARVTAWTPESRLTEAGPPGTLVRRTSACDPTALRPGWHCELIQGYERCVLSESVRSADTA